MHHFGGLLIQLSTAIKIDISDEEKAMNAD